MNKSKHVYPYFVMLAFAPLVLATLSCCPFANLPTDFLHDQDDSSDALKCIVPHVVGMDEEAARRSLVDLGLTPVKSNEYSDSVAAGLVISLDPAPGTQLEPCEGDVVMVVSLGPREPAVAPTEPPSALPTLLPTLLPPPPEQMPMSRLLFEEVFETGLIDGFRPEWSVDAAYDGSAAHLTEYGELVTQAYVAAYIGDTGWTDYSIKFGGGEYSRIEEFHAMIRMQDERNYIGIDCLSSDGWLACEGYKVINGQEQAIPGFMQQTTRLCANGQIQCDLELEAVGDQYRVLVNGEQKASATDSSFSQGSAGFVVDGRWVLDYFEVYAPPMPACPGFTLFRDDFDTNAWTTGTSEDENAWMNRVLTADDYRLEIKAKQDDVVVLQEIHEIHVSYDPDSFPYHFSAHVVARKTSGPESCALGLLFRCVDENNYYQFLVEPTGYASLYALENGEWVELVAPTPADAISPTEKNRLTVVADGSIFSFYINDEYVFQAEDGRFTTGSIGLSAEVSGLDYVGVVEFDTVQVFVP